MKGKKRRKHNTGKVILAGGLTIMLFGGGFLAFNHYVYAAAHNKPVVLQAAWQEPQEKAAKNNGYTRADYKLELDPVYNSDNRNAISAEEAAEIGAEYLWDVYGLELKDCTVKMFYSMDPSRAIGYWYGDVVEKGNPHGLASYRFAVEAVSGERESISHTTWNENLTEAIPYEEKAADKYYQENCGEYLELAKNYARHQLPAAPVSAEFVGTAASLMPGYEYELPEGAMVTMEPEGGQDPDVILIPIGEEIPAANVYVCIMVTDERGKQAKVEIDVTDKSLSSMENSYKGVDYDPNSIG